MSLSPQFSSEMTVIATRRSEVRLPVDMRARYGYAGAPTRALCRVADMTRKGARLTIYCDLEKESIITLNLPIAGDIRARIMWSKDFEAGCVFETPLSVQTFGAIMERFSGEIISKS